MRCKVVFTALLLTFVEFSIADNSKWSIEAEIVGGLYSDGELDSWISGGLGKTRVGPDDDSLILDAAISISYQASLQSRFVLETGYHSDPADEFGVLQAYWEFKPLPDGDWRSKYRIGAFHLPVSLENRHSLWQPVYTATPSLINAWIGEETRVIGAEGQWTWRPSRSSPHKITPKVGVFTSNDSAGAMLAWRGWTSHNRQTFLGEKLDLAALPVIQPGQPFEQQAPEFEPFVEVDDRPGHYVGLDWEYHKKAKIQYLYYDNQADPMIVEDGQYGWHTRFHHLGIRIKPAKDWSLVSQMILGNTIMGPRAVDNDFSSAFVLLSRKMGQRRLSARLETFRVEDRDFLRELDPNGESGNAFTVSYSVKTAEGWLFTLEGKTLRSDRDYYEVFGESGKLTDSQLNFQIQKRFQVLK